MRFLFSMTKSHFDRSRRPGLRRRGTEDVRGRGRRAGEMEASGICSDRSMCAVFFRFLSSFSRWGKTSQKKAASRGERVRASSSRENDHDYECRLVLSPGDNAKRLCTRRVRFFWIVEAIEELFFNNGLFLDALSVVRCSRA